MDWVSAGMRRPFFILLSQYKTRAAQATETFAEVRPSSFAEPRYNLALIDLVKSFLIASPVIGVNWVTRRPKGLND
jgi:hypothetical protein